LRNSEKCRFREKLKRKSRRSSEAGLKNARARSRDDI